MFGLIMVLFAFPLLLTGCIYANTEVNINPDGSGRVKLVAGYSKEVLNKLGQTPKDFSSKNNEYYLLKSGGKEYLAETWEDAYVNSEEINWSGVGSVSEEMGPVNLIPIPNGFKLNIKIRDEFGPNMKSDRILPELKNITRKSLEGMTLYDLIAQEADGLSLKATFNMPYEVKQTLGGTQGVTVKGKKITLDYMKLVKSEVKELEFKSVKTVKNYTFKDVPKNNPYYDAINSLVDGGLMKPYSDGTFKPNKEITLDELSEILVSGLGKKVPSDSSYWAKNDVKFAQKYKLFLSSVSPIKKNWNVPATREQAIYAITVGKNTQMALKEIKGDQIKDFNKIDSKMRQVILWAYSTGVLNIEDGATFNPKGKITRAEVAQILYNIHWTVPKSDIGSNFLNDLL